MPFRRWMWLCFSSLGCAALFAAGSANAQSAVSTPQSNVDGQSYIESSLIASGDASSLASGESSSLQLAEAAVPEGSAALPSAPAPSRAAQDQGNNNTYSGWHGRDIVNRLTIEAGFGANAPAGDKSYITWGDQFVIGGGVNINRYLATFIEYQFIDDKLPGAIIAEAGAEGGHDHIWSFSIDPVFDLFPKASNDVYLRGGGGFYRKVTIFTDVEATEFCEFYYCGEGYAPQTVGHFSSNQGGFDIGGGYQHRFGGMFGESRTRVFAEVRYVDVLSPAITTQPNGLGTTSVAADTKLIPITFGVRW